MGGGRSKPKPPPPPPTPVSEESLAEGEREKRRLKRRTGRASTILTGGQGVGEQNVGVRELLGG